MTSRHTRFTLVMLVSLLVALLSCTLNAATVKVVLVFGSGGMCSQTVNGTANTPFGGVQSGDTVQWTAKDTPAGPDVAFDLQFPAGNSPFYDYNSSSGSAVTSPSVPQGTRGTKYRYGSITINSKDCVNESSLGIIMR